MLAELNAHMRTVPMWAAVILPVLLTLLVGWVDQVTGWELSLFVVYALPIALAVWWSGARAGLGMAVLCGVVWWIANADVHPYETQLGYFWAVVNRECYFGVVVFAVMSARNKQDADAEHIRVLEQRRQLERDIVSVSEHEQQRIGQDLHDGLCQQLAAISLAARALAEDLETHYREGVGDAVMIADSVQQAMMEARSMARGIFPVHVDRAGLAAALQELAATTSRLTGVHIDVHETEESQVNSPETAMHLYRIAQEAVANAVRHGGAQHIVITLRSRGGNVEMTVDDDGSGVKESAAQISLAGGGGMGLRTMRYRAQILGAHLDVFPRSTGGTRVSCSAPVFHTHPDQPCPTEPNPNAP